MPRNISAALLLSAFLFACLSGYAVSQINGATFSVNQGSPAQPGTYAPMSWGISFSSVQCSTGSQYCIPGTNICLVDNPGPCPYVVATVSGSSCPQYPPGQSGWSGQPPMTMCSGASPPGGTGSAKSLDCVNFCDGWGGCPVDQPDGGCNSGNYCQIGGHTNSYAPPGQYNLCYWIQLPSGPASSYITPDSAGTSNTYFVENAPSSPSLQLTITPSSAEQSSPQQVQLILTSSQPPGEALWLEFSNSICTGIGNVSDGTNLPQCLPGSGPLYSPNPLKQGNCLMGNGGGTAITSNAYSVLLNTANLGPGTYNICGYQGEQPPVLSPGPSPFWSQSTWPEYSTIGVLTVVPCLGWLCNPPPSMASATNSITDLLCTSYATVNSIFLIMALALMLLGAVIWASATTLPGAARGTAQGYASGMIIAGVASAGISVVAIWLLTTATGNTVGGITAVCQFQQQALPSTYVLTMQGGGGLGAVSPSTGPQTAGSVVSIIATPAAGYTFGGWSGTGSGSTTCSGPSPSCASTSVTMLGPITETASFVKSASTYTLTTTCAQGGTGCGPSGSYAPGVPITLSASASSGYTFYQWVGTGAGSYSGTTQKATFSMPAANIQEKAEFYIAGSCSPLGSCISPTCTSGWTCINQRGPICCNLGCSIKGSIGVGCLPP